LRVPAGVDGKQTQGGQVEAIQKQLQQILPDIGKQIQMLAKTQQDMAAQIQANEASIQALSKATTKLAGTVTRAAETAEPRAPATRRGQIDPATPVGNGAPPLRGVIAPRPVPILGR
jgi:hypothetical protein